MHFASFNRGLLEAYCPDDLSLKYALRSPCNVLPPLFSLSAAYRETSHPNHVASLRQTRRQTLEACQKIAKLKPNQSNLLRHAESWSQIIHILFPHHLLYITLRHPHLTRQHNIHIQDIAAITQTLL
jgi:hypothetical protein